MKQIITAFAGILLFVQSSVISAQVTDYIPVKFHVVENPDSSFLDNQYGVSIDDLILAIDEMNEVFAEIGIEFYLLGINHFVDEDLSTIKKNLLFNNWDQDWSDLKDHFSEEDVLDIFFLAEIEQNIFERIGDRYTVAFADMPGNLVSDVTGAEYFSNDKKDAIAYNTIYFQQFDIDKLIHEIGHYFGLLHTFETVTSLTREKVDGSNCANAGDKICDTPADPYGKDPLNNNYGHESKFDIEVWVNSAYDPSPCTFKDEYDNPEKNYNYGVFAEIFVDPNGESYPKGDIEKLARNFMTYGFGGCMSEFTPGQYAVMLTTYINDRNYLRNENPVCTDALEPNNSSSQAFALGTSNSYYNNTLCLSAQDEDWFSFTHNSNDYFFKITGDNDLTSGDYTLQFNITADNLNVLTEFATEFTDTKVYLYDDELNQLAYDDNSNGVFGWITYTLPTASSADGPDIVMNGSLNKSFIEPGDNYEISGSISNNGDETTGQAFRIKYYLSDDIYVSADDDYLDNNIYNTLSSGATAPLNHDFTTSEDHPDGNYYLLVYVDANEEIQESNEANVFAFPITIGDVAIPVLTSPADDAENVAKNPTFSWSAVAGAESYDFAIYIGLTQVYFEGDLQSTGVNPSYTFEYGENYKWTARATVNGNTGDWAVLSSFKIRPYLDVPFLLSPAKGASNLDLFPTFSWDELPDANYYKVEVSPESDFSPDFDYRNITGTSFKVDDDDLLENTLYYWRVRGYSDQGTSEYSSVYTFTTGGSVVPGSPAILSPTSNETLSSTTPTISWNAGNGVTHTYQLDIATDVGFTNVVFTEDQIEFTEYQLPQNTLEPNTSYFVRVSGRNSQGYGSPSSSIQFTTGQNVTGPGSIQWTKTFSNLNYQGGSVPVFDYQGYMYITFPGTGRGTIHKIDPNTGETILTIFDNEVSTEEYQEPTFSHDGKTMYFIGDATTTHYPDTDYEYLVAANTDGDILWTTDLTLYSNNWKPALDQEGNIYVYGEDFSHRDNRPDQDALVSVDPDGNIRWTAKYSNVSSSTIGNPVVAGNKVFIARDEDAAGNGKIVAVNTSNGNTAWTRNLPSDELYEQNAGNPALAGSYMVFPSNNDLIYKISLSNGNNESGWPRSFSERSKGVSVIDENGFVYNGLDDNNTTLLGEAYSLTTSGSTRWSEDIQGDFLWSSVLDNNGVWYFGGNDGTVYAYDKDTGAEVWSTNLGKRAYGMTIGPKGTLFVCTETRTDGVGLYAINTEATGLNTGSWPVKHHDNQGTGNYNHSAISYEFPLASPIVSPQNITNESFELSWTAVSDATSYFVDISTDSFSTFLDGYENLELAETSLQVSDLNEGSNYQVRIKSDNADTESIYSVLEVMTLSNTAPSSILLLNSEIDENMAAGTTVGEIQIIDADITDQHLIELVVGEGDDDNGVFAVSESHLVSQVSFDFETKNLYTIRLRATDSFGGIHERVYLIEVLDVFEKFDQTINFEAIPLQTFGNDTYDLDVNSSSALPVTIVSHNPAVVTIEDGVMSIVGTGQTLISATNDGNEYYNAATKVTRTVLVDKASQTVTIDELPVFKITDDDYELSATSSAGLGVTYEVENTSIAELVNGTHLRMLAAGSTNLVITQVGNDNYYPAESVTVSVSIEKLTQIISFSDIPQISLGDGPLLIDAFSSAGLDLAYEVVSGSAVFVGNELAINDGGDIVIRISQAGNDIYEETSVEVPLSINYPPSSIDLSNSFIDENAGIETLIGMFTTSDQDQTSGHVFQLEDGVLDNDLFKVNDEDQLISNGLFDFESSNTYNIRVLVTDDAGAQYSKDFDITIQDVNEAPTASGNRFSIDENTPVSSLVGLVNGIDPENQTLNYSITDGNELGAFQIDAQTGEITIANAEFIDFESHPTFQLTVEISDGELTTEAIIHVDLNDLNEPPSSSDEAFELDENAAIGTNVGSVVGIDPESDELAFYVIDGNELGAFALDIQTGSITIAEAEPINFEFNPNFILTVAIDDGQLESTAEIRIDLRDINESPTIQGSTFAIEENSAPGTAVGTVQSADEDNDPLVLAISSGNEDGAFRVDAQTGEITVADSAPLDYESTKAFILSVVVTDGEFAATAIIIVNLEDVVESEEPVLGVDKEGNPVKIYPNPTTDYVDVEWTHFEEAMVYDVSGKGVLLETKKKKLDLRTLKPGTYNIYLKGNNELLKFKIIKQ